MTTTRTAAEALEEVLALEQKATPGTYRYSPWHVEEGEAAVRTSKGNLDWAITFASDNDAEFIATVVNFIRTHADTLRAALAPPQEGEVEECADRLEAMAEGYSAEAAKFFRNAASLLRATQINGHSPDDALAPSNGNPFPSRPVESPAPSTPAQEGESTREQIDAGWVADLAYEDELKNAGYTHADRRERVRRILRAARLLRATQSNGRGAGTNVDDKPGCIGPDTPASPPAQSAPAQEPVATLEAKVSTLLARALTTGYGSTEAIYALANLAREPLFAAPPPDEARELLVEVVRRYDDYRGKGVMPAPGEYQMVVGAIERIRAFLEGKK